MRLFWCRRVLTEHLRRSGVQQDHTPATGILSQLLGGLGRALLRLPHEPCGVVGELEVPPEGIAGPDNQASPARRPG